MTVTLMQTLLKEATDNADFYSPLLVLEVSSMIFRKRDAEPQEFINVRKQKNLKWKSNVYHFQEKLIGNVLWTNNHFWETALFGT